MWASLEMREQGANRGVVALHASITRVEATVKILEKAQALWSGILSEEAATSPTLQRYLKIEEEVPSHLNMELDRFVETRLHCVRLNCQRRVDLHRPPLCRCLAAFTYEHYLLHCPLTVSALRTSASTEIDVLKRESDLGFLLLSQHLRKFPLW